MSCVREVEGDFSVKMDKVANSKNDEFYTPAYAVNPILKYLKNDNFKSIWCPFDTKESFFVKSLSLEGFRVLHTHIKDGNDFFSTGKTIAFCTSKPKNEHKAIFSLKRMPPWFTKEEKFKLSR